MKQLLLPSKRYLALLILLLLTGILHPPAQAQTPLEPPLFETRGVWLTTTLRLDWPPPATPRYQEFRLREMIQDAKAMGLNTIMFQAVSRGDAMYPSQRLPWSPWLTGTPGQDPGWDPLAVAIEEAHRLGMELHVWFNVYRVGDSSTPMSENTTPQHVVFAHPEWVEELTSGSRTDYWLNPAYPEAREWLIGNVMEIVENYDIDAMHFDYIRYPAGGFNNDGENFLLLNPDGISDINEWRRENINKFVRAVYWAIQEIKPWVKVGSAPIGRYYGSEGDFVGYNGVFQASRQWLEEGVHDYLSPQIYWDIEHWPHFNELAHEWVNESYGRHIYTGIAAYRSEVYAQIPRQIDTARVAGAMGQVYFRYYHIDRSPPPFGSRYTHPAIRPPMPWKFEAQAPTAPTDLTVEILDEHRTQLSWQPATPGTQDPLGGYAIFRKIGSPPDPSRAEDLLTYISASDTLFTDVFTTPPDEPIYYRVVAFSRLGFTSEASSPVNITLDTESIVLRNFRILATYPNPARDRFSVRYETNYGDELTLTLYDMLGRKVLQPVQTWHAPGQYRTDIDVHQLASGLYILELRNKETRITTRILVTH